MSVDNGAMAQLIITPACYPTTRSKRTASTQWQ
eukprot:COSAG03_NODE_20131_length_324_cov_0.680000_1_plen_32_part_01